MIDRFDNRTVVDEPAGWDALSFKLKRHPERHGTFRELQTNQFRFYEKGYQLLKAEYEAWGIRGRYDLQIDGQCGFGYEALYRGRLSFDAYSDVCGPECYAVVGCDQTGPMVDFINRFDQKVEIGNPLAFDQTTALTAYPNLSKVITLPSKAILIRTGLENTENQSYKLSNDSGWFPVADTGTLNSWINIPFTQTAYNSIRNIKPTTILDLYNWSNDLESPSEIIDFVEDQELNCINTLFDVNFRVKGRLKNNLGGSGEHVLSLVLKKGRETLISTTVIPLEGWILSTSGNFIFTHEFDFSWSGQVTLEPGEKLWFALFFKYIKTTNYSTDVDIEIDKETFFKAQGISKCDPTPGKVYLVHETTSRVIESITNNGLKLKSSYYGRTDSQPFAFDADGCGGLRALTTGLDIRRAKLSDGSDPKFFLSMKDIFQSLNAIDNIGLGEEGGDEIVLEEWRYFYQDEVGYTCSDIERVEKTNVAAETYSVFKVGYEKWETEDYDGLDEFLTKREFRTALSEVQNPFEQICGFIASGYAWEATRRKGPDSKDWRYDNETFIVCLQREGDSLGVEVDNILAAANLLDPPTVYNWRISPWRNALRWFNRVAACYRHLTDGDGLLFSAGDGNYLASGLLTGGCVLEAAAVAENSDITRLRFADPVAAAPITRPERIKYTYPMTFAEYRLVAANRHKLIAWQSRCEKGAGWIDELEYLPEDGQATFTLIPKVT